MKSPWKFVGQLLSRGKAAGPRLRAADVDTEEPLHETLASLPVLGNVESAVAEVVDLPEVNELSKHMQFEVSAPNPVIEIGVHLDQTDPRGAGSRRPSKRIAQATIAHNGPKHSVRQKRLLADRLINERNGLEPSHTQAIRAEIIGTDAEVRALSHQLAEKLREQNDQLRKMLERFGGS